MLIMYIVTAVIIAMIIAVTVIIIKVLPLDFHIESASRRAGRRGEEVAAQIIREVLREDDHLLINVEIKIEGKPAELDCVVVNKYGVFIFEVKNYSGQLCGGEDDYEWQKIKITDAGNIYTKHVKNPIRQLKRQIYVLAKYLEYYGRRVWVEGYVILLRQNSPVKNSCIIMSRNDIDRAIHTKGKILLKKEEVQQIVELLG